ncbi:MAG: excinuclease ABC subunit C [Bacteroidales bacterium]|nr:MAG: excinuclease ABC subunit C [Bacteroidales bacterium]
MTRTRHNTSHLKLIVSVLPENPGVYQFLDKDGTVIYIGKAKNLRKRMMTYLGKTQTGRTKVLVSKIHDIQHIIVNSESDALLLENNLIKKYQPRYNIQLKDDKSFPLICIKNEAFPRVFYTRNLIDDGSQYYGPYTSVVMVKTLLDMIRQLYPLRNCKYKLIPENIRLKKFKLCLEYHMGKCKGPCEGLQTEAEYNGNIDQIREIIRGNIGNVFTYMKGLMQKYATEYRYEEANYIKEKIKILERYQSKSTIVSSTIRDVDVFSITDDAGYAFVNFLKVVNGAIIQAHTLEIKKRLEEDRNELLPMAITEIRQRLSSTAKEIIVPFRLNIPIADCKITVPKKGDKMKLLELSERNVTYYRLQKLKRVNQSFKSTGTDRILERIKHDLRLSSIPVHIECFDNSNLQGANPVAACVVFRNARPRKREYRHYNVKTVKGPNDFASMQEILLRRYSRMIDEGLALPQLIVVDGGKGQVNAAVKSLEKLSLRGRIAVIGIAKRLEEIYFPKDPLPLYLDKNSETLKLIQYLRNEAHRFGISFHRKKRSGDLLRSELDNIKGIGSVTIQKLFSEYKSVEGLKKASLADLVKSIGNAKAGIVYNYFH